MKVPSSVFYLLDRDSHLRITCKTADGGTSFFVFRRSLRIAAGRGTSGFSWKPHMAFVYMVRGSRKQLIKSGFWGLKSVTSTIRRKAVFLIGLDIILKTKQEISKSANPSIPVNSSINGKRTISKKSTEKQSHKRKNDNL